MCFVSSPLRVLETDPLWRLVYTFLWDGPKSDNREIVVNLALGSTGEATRLVLSHQTNPDGRAPDLHRQGWTKSFEKLQAVLGSRT